MKYCVVVPHYNHERQFVEFLPKILAVGYPCIIVDDGSQKESLDIVEKAAAENEQVILIKHAFNRGKGAAVFSGFYHARTLGFTHVIQIDADGQHNEEDINRFVLASKDAPHALICGKPVFDSSVPKARLYGRKVTDFWVIIETLSRKIRDGLCGFRVYPLDEVEKVMDRHYIGSRMDFDPEILVKAVWENVELKFLETPVIYPEQSVSHFKYLRDNIVMIRLHVRLMLGFLPRIPLLIYRMIFR